LINTEWSLPKEEMPKEEVHSKYLILMSALQGNRSVPVGAGHMLRVPKDGVIMEPVLVDLKKINRWWEKD
jgi:hypothetical protein